MHRSKLQLKRFNLTRTLAGKTDSGILNGSVEYRIRESLCDGHTYKTFTVYPFVTNIYVGIPLCSYWCCSKAKSLSIYQLVKFNELNWRHAKFLCGSHSRHGSVDPSTPSILQPKVRSPITNFTLFQFISEFWWEKDKNKNKNRTRLVHYKKFLWR